MKIGFVSLGCPKNLVDAEVMLGLAEEAGQSVTPIADGADVLVVNTCAFIDRAKEESVEYDSRDGRAQEAGAGPATGRDRLSRGALSRRAAAGDSRDRCRSRHGRSAEDSRGACPGPSATGSDRHATGLLQAGPGHVSTPGILRNLASTFPTISTTPTLPVDSRRPATTPTQDCRRLRLQVRVLHHPQDARALPQPHRPSPSSKRRDALAARGRRKSSC